MLALTIVALTAMVAPVGTAEKKSRGHRVLDWHHRAGHPQGEPIDAAGVNQITAGPDGNLWFIEEYGDRIGRITPKGKVTEFSVGITPGAFLSGITAGPDGNVWFTDAAWRTPSAATTSSPAGSDASPKGEVTEFSAGITTRSSCAIDGSCGDSSASPESITAGPDGNLWFTEHFAGRIGRITPDGIVTEFADGIGTWGGGFRNPNWLGGITAGPDGNLWFADSGGLVGRITPAGVISYFGAGITETLGITAGATATSGSPSPS